jgi:hypothetical protein
VVVIAEKGVATDLGAVELLGPAQDAEHDLVELVARAQEEAAVDGSGGDFDEGLFARDEA